MEEQKLSFFVRLNFREYYVRRGLSLEDAKDQVEKSFPADDWQSLSDNSILLMFILPNVAELSQEQIAWLDNEPLIEEWFYPKKFF